MNKIKELLRKGTENAQTNPNMLTTRNDEKYVELTGFIKDATVSYMIVELRQLFDNLMIKFPVNGITFEQYLVDLKTLSSTNPYAPVLTKETDQYLSFKCDFIEIDAENVIPAIPALKEYVQFVKQQSSGLRNYSIQQVHLNSSGQPKIFDVASLWYDGHSGNDKTEHLNILPIKENPTKWILYIFGELPAEILNDFPRRASEIGATYDIRVV